MRDVRAGVEVRALIGAEKLRELREDAFARHGCRRCGRTGQMTEPTSAIVLGYRVFRAVRLTHAGRAESQIFEIDAAGMRAAAELARRNTASTPGGPAGSSAAARPVPAWGCPA